MLTFTFENGDTSKDLVYVFRFARSLLSARRLILRSQISTKLRIGCRTANTIDQFSHALESR